MRWRPEHTLERWAQAVHPPWVKKLVPERALKALRNAFPVGRKKTPFIMQMEAVECGAAALAIVLGYYGRFVPLAQLRVDCGVSRDGSKASSILKAARKHGLVAKGYSKGLNKLEEVRLPAIVFWEFNHFIVLEGFSEDYVFVNDPAYGHRRIPRQTFSDGFTGVVLAFEPSEDFQKSGSLPSPFPTLWRHTEGSRQALLFVMICGLFAAVPGIALAACTRVLLDEVIAQGNYDWLRPLLSALGFVLVLQLSLTALSGLFFRRLRMGLSARLSAKFYRHLLQLPYQFYSQRYVGDVVDRSRLIDGIVGLVAGQLTGTAVGMVMMVLFGFVLFSYNPLLAGIGVLASVVNFALLRMVAKSRVESNIVISKEAGKVQGLTIAVIHSIDTIKASGLESSMYEKWAGAFAASSNSKLQLELDNRLFTVLPTLTNTVVTTATLLIGGLQVMAGEMTFGTLMAFNILMGQFLAPIGSLLGLAVQMQQIRGNVVRLEDVMEHPTRQQLEDRLATETEGKEPAPVSTDAAPVTAALPPPEPTAKIVEPESPVLAVTRLSDPSPRTGNFRGTRSPLGPVDKARLDGHVSFRGINYGYSPLGDPLIRDFNLEIRPGERIALVGRSGCGKSTIAKLAAGLLFPWSGRILFDGRQRQEIPPDLLVSSAAMIEQDLMFFSGSIRANLTLWDETIPEKWVLDACEDADILDTILALPGGLDATVAEGGGNFSGGQRQRLEIARSLVRQPTFLILDEATSALDTETEAKILHNVHRRGCSCLIVAHRLSTIRNCHKIIVMDSGRVVETGTYDELWEKRGMFASLLKTK